jgi:hypothetical protein
MNVRGRDVAAGVALGLLSSLGAIALAYVAVRPSIPATVERVVYRELLRYRETIGRENPVAAALADVVGTQQIASLVARIAAEVAREKLP